MFAFLYFYKSFVRQGLDVVMASCPKALVLKLRQMIYKNIKKQRQKRLEFS